ncbi:hypothetical protein CH352_13850 [Leptospira hartskeerlii]|uniref:Short-chain dehydrogenase n=1 Tax=Leptospira hartskeerlii TaxID=2023177 RepID=A0A2M9XA32_9LEPT|nr:hypothetical protein [Leptospira hartskeerlii]PJZ24504.1 hypothetical protein CH357_15655 [Leptospira hartskeerlii]PJZ32884.1 hypothetical protein CH352_13850 [Leptospira hartskeerlii]
MSESIALIIGGSGAAGQSAIEGLREHSKKSGVKWNIISTTSADSQINGADKTIHHIQLEEPDIAVQKVLKEIQNLKIELFIYTPARGNLGYPVSETPDADIINTAKFCLDPMVELETKLKPRLTIGYSAFYYLPHLLTSYGALAFIKKKMEEWALEKPDSRKMIRAGSFISTSARGIGILLQKIGRTSPYPELQNLMKEHKESGKKFSEFFWDYVRSSEKRIFEKQFPNIPYRATEQNDLKIGLLKILDGEKAPIVSLIGDWIWTEDKLPDMPEYLKVR